MARVSAKRGQAFVDRVFRATLELLGEVGFDGLSIPGVAERVGANKTSLYRRWPTRVDLLRDVLEAHMGASQTVTSSGNLRADLMQIARAAVAFVESPLGRSALGGLLAAGAHPDIRAIFTEIMRAGARGPRLLFRQARARGELAEDVDVDLLLSVVAGAFMHRALIEHRPLGAEFVQGVVDLVLARALARKH